MSGQQLNVLGAGLIGGFCLLSGVGLGAYRAGSSSGRKFKKVAAKKARANHSVAIKAAQDQERKRADALVAEAKQLQMEVKDLNDRVSMIERKHPVLRRAMSPYTLELLEDTSVPLAEVVRRTIANTLAAFGQGRKVEVTKLKQGYEVTIELDTPLSKPMIADVRKAATDLIKHTPKVWIEDLRITRPARDQTISLGPIAKLSPVAIGDAVEAFVGNGVRMPPIKPVMGAKAQLVVNRARYPGLVHWFGPQESHGSGSGSASGQANGTFAVPPGTYFVTANLGGIVFRQTMRVEAKRSYRVQLSAFKFPAGRRPNLGIVVPPRSTRYPPPTRYRSRRYTPPPRYRSRRYTPPPPRPRYTPPPRTRSRRSTPSSRSRYRSRRYR